MYIRASYTAEDRTQGGATIDGDVTFNLAGPSSLNDYSFYVVYNATYYYNDGSSESVSSYTTAGVKAVTQISTRQGRGVCGGTISATIYGCGLTTTDSVSVGNTSGGGGDASS